MIHNDGDLPDDPKAIWVFGSNLSGVHGAGAAKVALNRFGAVSGRSSGLVGRSYAIPTKGLISEGLPVLSLDEISDYVFRFVEFAEERPDLNFWVTRIGCGLAGYRDSEIAPLFAFRNLPNCNFPEPWCRWLAK